MKLSDLHYDILSAIFSQLPRSDASRLSRTCRATYELGSPYLSRTMIVYHEAGEGYHERGRVIGQCKFMLADPHLRLPCLRDFELLGSPWYDDSEHAADEEVSSLLLRVLSRAHQLEYLRIMSADTILNACPELLEALAALPNIRSLSLDECGKSVVTFLWRTASHPVSLDLNGCLLQSSQYPHLGPLPINLLASVRQLSFSSHILISADSFAPGEIKEQSDLVFSTVWPSITSLRLQGPIDEQKLGKAFPHLRVLDYTGESLPNLPGRSRVSWPHLETVIAWTPLRLRIKGAAPVRKAALYFTHHVNEECGTLLQALSPIVLTFTACLSQASTCPLLQRYFGAPAALARLRFLEIYFVQDEDVRVSSRDIAVDSMALSKFFTPSQLEVFGYYNSPRPPTPSCADPSVFLNWISLFRHAPLVGFAMRFWKCTPLETGSLETFTTEVQRMFPTLKYICVDRKWSAVDASAEPPHKLVAIPSSDGDELAYRLKDPGVYQI